MLLNIKTGTVRKKKKARHTENVDRIIPSIRKKRKQEITDKARNMVRS